MNFITINAALVWYQNTLINIPPLSELSLQLTEVIQKL